MTAELTRAADEARGSGPLTHLVVAHARTRPDAVAVAEAGRRLTYGDLDRASGELALRLRQMGVIRGSVVALLMERSAELVVAELAVLRAGAAFLPIDPDYPPARQRYVLTDSNASVLLTKGPVPAQVATSATVLDVSALAEPGTPPRGAEDPEPALGPDDLAYLIYTSGSTGRPKGVAITHGGLRNLVAWHHRAFAVTADDRAILLAGVGFDALVLELWPLLAAGATLAIPAPDIRQSPQRLRDFLIDEQITLAFVATAYAEALLELPWPSSAALRFLLTGGDRLHRRPAAGLPFILVNNYGPTETSVVATSGLVAAGSGEPDIGAPIDATSIRMLDPAGRPVALGQVGELYVGGAGVARGYHGRPDLTAERFLPDPDGPPGARLYRTGDLARWGNAGTLEYVGRVDAQVQVRGHRVEPGEVETVLAEHPAVRSAVVVAGTDSVGATALTGYVVARDGQRPDPAGLRAYLRDRLPAAMVPAAVVLVPALPITPNGKIDRLVLVADATSTFAQSEPTRTPRTETEAVVLGIWREVLGQNEIGPDDLFDERGGHSLSALRVATRIAATLGVDVPLEVFLAPLTVADLARRVQRGPRRASHGGKATLVRRTEAERPGEPLALSFSQRRLWYLDQLVPDSPLYAVPLSFAIEGGVDPDVLEEAINQVVARHEPLYARYVERDGEPVQYLQPPARIRLSVATPADDERAAHLVREAAQSSFDLSTGPLLRALLLPGGAGQHHLLLTVHHIAIDGWSVGVFLAELGECYAALRQGRQPNLPALPIRHRDLVVRQHEQLAFQLDRQLAYWRERLDPSPPPLHLPTDHPRPDNPSYRGAKLRRSLPPPLLDGLRELGRASGASLFMVMFAAFEVLLHRYSGREDIVTGVPVAGRDDPQSERLIGFLANTLALRVDLTGNPRFTDLLAQVRRSMLDATANADVPLERVVEELTLDRAAGHNPLFQVLFVMQNLPEQAVSAGGVHIRLVEEVDNGCAKFDLLVFVDFPAGRGPVLTAEYATDLFDAGTIDRLLANYVELLTAVVAQPSARAGHLPMLGADDRRIVLAEPADPAGDVCLHTLVEWQVLRTPEAIAVRFEGDRLTYEELNRRADRLARHLRRLGVGPDVPVAVFLDRSLELAVTLLAILKAGGAYVPLDPSYPASRLLQILTEVAAPVLIGQSGLLDRLPNLACTVVRPGDEWAEPAVTADAEGTVQMPVGPDNLAYVLFTSGSTGRPKGVTMPHRAVANLIEWQRTAGGLAGAARTLQFAALGFDVSCQEIFTTWAGGGTLLMVSDEVRRDLNALLPVLDEAGVERIFVPFVALHHLAEAAQAAGFVPGSLRDIVTAGERLQITPPVAWLMAQLPHAALHNHYGPTETHVASAHQLHGNPSTWPLLPSIGRPVAGAYARILDGSGQPVPAGVPGELHLGGVCLARGYYGRADLTAERFVPDPLASPPGGRLYSTGDLARYRADGTIEFLGRADDQVKIRGHRVEPGEVEAVLTQHPTVREAVVVTREPAGASQTYSLVAYVVPCHPDGAEAAGWRRFLAERLPEYMVPSGFVAVDALPLTPSGKVDRRALPEPDALLSSAPGYVAPDSALAAVIAEVWSDVLGIAKVGLNDDFFALGGHSLVATRVISRLREALEVEVPLRLLFAHPSVGALATALTAEYGERPGARRLPGIARRTSSDRLPLSSAQLRLWYLDQTVPDRTAYLLPLAYRLAGPLDVAALCSALDTLVSRHEALRTTFGLDDGQPVQAIGHPVLVDVPVLDLTRVPAAERDADLARRLATEAGTPMDLATGPLLRARLLSYGADEHVLLLTLHHIVADEWSLNVLHRELGELYAAGRTGRPANLPELPIQYADFALWQRDWLTGSERGTQLEYWRQALQDAPALLDLPTNRPRPPVASSRGRTLPLKVRVDPATVRSLARHLKTTPYMVLLAAFQALLSRYTGQHDIVVGSPVNNRGRTELEGLIGFLVNTVPIRVDLAGDLSFAAVVARVRTATLDAHAHQDLPFERLVEALRPDRRPDHDPVFQVMFLHADQNAADLRLPGLTVTALRTPSHTAKFDLTLAVRDEHDELEVLVEYRTDLFDDDTMVRLLGHYETLLAAAVAAPDTAVAALPLLTVPQQRQLLHDWNDTAWRPDDAVLAGPEDTVPALFAARCRATPDAVAVADLARTLTYQELDAHADALASALGDAGVGRGDLVAVCLPRGAELVVAILAVLKAGAAYVPLDPDHPATRLRLILEDTRAAVALTVAALRERVPAPTVLELDTLWDAPSPAVQPRAAQPPVPVGPDDLVYVIYTSGSTGRPKGVMVTHRGVVNYARWAGRVYRIGSGERAPVHSSVAFDLTVTSLLVPLLNGGATELLPEADGVAELGEALRRVDQPYSLVKITPAHLEIVAGQLSPAEAARRTAAFVIGGENLSAERVSFWREHAPGTRLINEYGPTETVVGCATYEVDPSTPTTGSVPIGRPIDNTRLYVLDEYLNPVPVGVTGELYIGGYGVARGYLHRPDLTADRFVPDPYADRPGQRLYRSGDLVRYRPDGNLEFVGRRDDQVKLHGYRIELGEIEAVLARQPQVAAATVLLREDLPGDKRLVGYIVPSDVKQMATAALPAALAAELPKRLVPAAFVVLERLPLTANGKVDVAALPAPATAVAVSSPAAGRLAERIAAVWREVLGAERVGPHDNFFDLGGHSLLLLQVHRALREIVGDSVTVTDLFRHPTVHALATFLSGTDTEAALAPAPTVRTDMPTRGTAVAIVSMACRFPGADSPEALWATVRDGQEAIRNLSEAEILADGEDPVLLADPHYIRAAAPLADIDQFDATVFGYTAREAEILDPQQRLFLECAWEALERAGYGGGSYRGPVGVFAGSGRSTYLTENLLTAPEVVRSVGEYQLTLSTDKDFLATRVSYKLNLHGPSISVNTACSTSLVAVHLARQALLAGECDLALAGGASVAAAQHRGYLYRPGDIASPDGRCRPFDAAAQGTIGSSGAGVVVLKRLDDAIADGDTIHAVLLGSAINNDGARKVGFTAPGVDGQAEVITAALDAAGISPRTVGYVEAHGTATTLGDPVEIAALTQAYRRHTPDAQFCAVGSVKSNIGHSDAAAGIAGLIKTVMALESGVLPPTVHFTSPNPRIPFAGSPFYATGESRPWPAGPRRAGVSSFGIGGTNAHVILEQAPIAAADVSAEGPQLLVLSASSAPALHAATDRLAAHLRDNPEIDLGGVAATLQRGRWPMAHRRILVARNTGDAANVLAGGDPCRLRTGALEGSEPGIAFVFPGQGTQYPTMGAGLYRGHAGFRALVDESARKLLPAVGLDLRELLYPEPSRREQAQELLRQTRLAQPALFTVEYALARVLIDGGMVPEAMAGHSIGEYVAACLAGVFDLADALLLVAERGRLMQQLPPGAMLAVSLAESEVRPLLGEVCLAAVNAPGVSVLAGPTPAIDDIAGRLRERGIATQPLHTSHAFHSAMTEPIVPAFVDLVRQVPLRAPRQRYLSNTTGTWITAQEATDPEYWGRHLRQPVRFADCAQHLTESGAVVLEVGPGRSLGNLLRQAGTPAGHAVSLMRRATETGDDLEVLLEGIGLAWLRGATVDWEAFQAGQPRRRVPLPTYPFQRRRYWVDRRQQPRVAVADPPAVAAPALVDGAVPPAGAAHERPELTTEYVAPRDDVEARLAVVWEELFGVSPIGVHDNFFELGGHSLLATQLLARVRADAADLSMEAVFDHPTIAGLAVALAAVAPAVDPQPRTVQDVQWGTVQAAEPVERDLPLSAGQRRLWFLDQAHPDNAAYTIAMAFELHGELDLAALRAALDGIVGRHEALRTVFPAPDGEPVQRVLPPRPVSLSVVERVGDGDTDDEVRRLLREEGRRPYDLAIGPLFRATLWRIGEARHVLSLNMHHIVSDGWSLGVLRRELGLLYDAFHSGRASSLPPLPVQYADHVAAQAQTDSTDLAYWLRRLRGAPAALDLPTDRPRPPVQTFQGAVVTRILPSELADRLRAFSRRHGVTLYMTVLAALQTLLYRYTGQRDICVGTPIAARARAETEPLVGFFVNTLVMRAMLDGSTPFADLLAQVRRTSLGAQAHQEMPFEQLVDQLHVARDLSRNPLFQVMFNLLNLPEEQLRMSGLRARPLPLDFKAAQVDLSMYVYETDAGLDCRLEYNSALFDPETVERMLGHLMTLLADVVADPATPLDDLAILTPAETDRQLIEWNDTADDAVPSGTVADLVAAQVARTPDRVAVTFAARSLTYRELDSRADRLAGHLRALGVGPEVLVAVALERSETTLVTLLAVLKAGGVHLPLDPMYPAERHAYILDNARPKVLVTQRSLAGRYDDFSGRRFIVDADDPAERPAGSPADVDPNNAAYVLYTSGSTGRPKGVRLPHHALVNLLHALRDRVGITEADTFLAITTTTFDISLVELFLPLTVGARVVMASRDDAYDGRRVAALLEAEQVTMLQATPATWRMLVAAGWPGSPRLTAITGGETLPPALAKELIRRVGRLWNLYGPTETTIYSTGAQITAETTITIGRPLTNETVYLLDARMRPVPIGIAGEIYLGGVGLARDYLNQPDATADRFVPDPFTAEPGQRMYRTGDLARYRADGSIDLIGRNDFQVKLRGYRIELGEIETLLQQDPVIRQAAVVLREDEGEPQLVAYLTLHPGGEAADWRTYLRRYLPEYMVPSAFIVLPEFTLTPNGKLDRRALPAPPPATAAIGPATALPRTELEASIAARWAQVLRLDALGIDDNFFDLGGDSFKAVRAVSGMGEYVGVLDIFMYPTVRALAAHLGEEGDGRRSLLHRLTPPRLPGTVTAALICVPFAGGGAITYRRLAEAAPANLNVYALDPPGHDVNRPDEPALSLPELVSGCVDEIAATISGPVTIYGHCMGGATAIELARRLEERGVDLVRVAIGGHFPAPPLPGRFFAWLRRMFPIDRWTSKRQALDFLRAVGFFTEQLTAREKDFLMGVFLHDAREGEEHYARVYADPHHRKIKAPILSVVGQSDRVTELYEERHREWEHFAEQVDLEVIPDAGHYFHNHQAAELVEIIQRGPATPEAREKAVPAPPAATPPATRPRRAGAGPSLRVFMLVALGQLVSLAGTGLTTFAMGLWVYQRTGSITLFATTAMMALLPAVFLAPVAGALADRMNKRLIMACADTLAAGGTVTLAALLWAGRLELWHVYLVVTVGAIGSAFQQPAYLAAISQLVPKRYYGRANGLAQLGTGAGNILGPLLGGALAVTIGLRGIVLIDLATFLFAITVTLSVRFPNTLFKQREEPFLQEMLGGWRYITRRHGLVAIIAFTAALNFLFGMIEVLATPLTLSMADPTVLGMVLGASGAGLLVGGVGMSIWGGTQRRMNGILGSFGLIGISMVVIGLYPHPIFPALGLFGLGLATAVLNAHWLALVQTKVGLELQGRVIATTLMLSWLMVPAGFLSAGPLAKWLDASMTPRGIMAGPVVDLLGTGPGRHIALVVILGGLATILLGLAAHLYRPVRLLEEALPDAIPDPLIITDKNRLQELADARLATAAPK